MVYSIESFGQGNMKNVTGNEKEKYRQKNTALVDSTFNFKFASKFYSDAARDILRNLRQILL